MTGALVKALQSQKQYANIYYFCCNKFLYDCRLGQTETLSVRRNDKPITLHFIRAVIRAQHTCMYLKIRLFKETYTRFERNKLTAPITRYF